MTPRCFGWSSGAAVFVALAALQGAAAIAQRAASDGDGSGAAADLGGFALSVLVRVVPLAVGGGLLVAVIAASARGRIAAAIAAGSSYLVAAGWIIARSLASPPAPGEDPVASTIDLVAAGASLGTALALAAAAVTWWIVVRSVGRDGPERLLGLETTGLRGSRARWGAAMRAELAGIDHPVERRRFARSAGALAFRRGTGAWPPILAAVAGVGAGIVVFAAARISFERPRDRGILSEPLMGLVVLLLAVVVIAGTLIGRSFRAGLETAVLAWLSVYVCTLAVEIPQALAWYRAAGILLLDGDPAAGAGVDAVEATFQPLTHFAFVFTALAWLVVAVGAAAVGAMVLRVAQRFGMPRAGRDAPNLTAPRPAD